MTVLLFTRLATNLKNQTYLIDLNKKKLKKITNTSDRSEFSPRFFSADQRIYFVASSRFSPTLQRAIANDIFSLTLDGQNLRQITDYNCFYISQPSFNFLEKQFVSQLDCNDRKVWAFFTVKNSGIDTIFFNPNMINFQGKQSENHDCQYCAIPTFHPTENKIAFSKPPEIKRLVRIANNVQKNFRSSDT